MDIKLVWYRNPKKIAINSHFMNATNIAQNKTPIICEILFHQFWALKFQIGLFGFKLWQKQFKWREVLLEQLESFTLQE